MSLNHRDGLKLIKAESKKRILNHGKKEQN
jgi:hypothetical protein